MIEDKFEASGTQYDDFKETITEFAKRTNVLNMPLNAFKALHYDGECLKDDKMSLKLLQSCNDGKKVEYKSMNKQNMIDACPEIYEELLEQKTLFVDDAKVVYPLSKYCWNTLLQKLGLSGPMFAQSSLARDIYLTYALSNSKEQVQIITRKIGNKQKIFGFFTDRYFYIPQDIILTVIDKISEQHIINFRAWNICQLYTEVFIDCPEQEFKIGDVIYTPGFRISTSDAGFISFSIQPILTESKNQSIVILDSSEQVQIAHKKSVKTCSDIVDDKLLRQIEDVIMQASLITRRARQDLIEKEKEKISAKNVQEMVAYASKLAKNAGFQKISGIKTLRKELPQYIPEKKNYTKVDAINALFCTKHSNQTDFVTKTRYDAVKSKLLALV